MNKKYNSLTLFQWSNFDIEEIKKIHEIAYMNRICNTEFINSPNENDNRKIKWNIKSVKTLKEGKKRVKPNWNILLPKYKFLCHNIIARCSGIQNGGATFSATILEKVLGEYYSIMLETLAFCQYIYLGKYTVGKESRVIWLENLSFCRETTTNKKIISYNNKLKGLVKDSYVPLSNDLFDYYSKALKTLTLNQYEALKATDEKYSSFLKGNLTEKESKEQEKEYKWRISRIQTFEYTIPKQDKNGRIYHYLTNFPSDLLPYTNVKYELDAKNCHPMLFSLFLIYFYNIASIKIDNNLIYNFNSSTIYNHYPMDFLGKALTNSELGELRKGKGNSVPNDVEEYIRKTFEGRLWDDYTDKFPNVSRDKIKRIMFSQVFYSYDNVVYVRDETVRDKFKFKYAKKYARAFKQDYPNVWAIIGQFKRIGKKRLGENPNDEKNSFFPCLMMRLEATIFREIMRRCYDRGYTNIVNIHDAICVIENDMSNYSSDDIKNIMLEVFREYGLYPNIKLEKIDRKVM